MNEPRTNYSDLSDAELNALVAVRVCGWKSAAVYGNFERWAEGSPQHGCNMETPLYSTDLNAAFAAQVALAGKGDKYEDTYHEIIAGLCPTFSPYARLSYITAMYRHFLTAPPRIRCIAMLMAMDEMEKK